MTPVEKGKAWMDAVHPGWQEIIDWNRLDMQYGDRCILGQIAAHENGLSEGFFTLYLISHGLTLQWATDNGFAIDYGRTPAEENSKQYRLLTEQWKQIARVLV